MSETAVIVEPSLMTKLAQSTTDEPEQLADFGLEPIAGFATHGGSFACPLITRIEGNLWMGGCPKPMLPAPFKYVVNLYPWGHYMVGEGVTELKCWLYDDLHQPINSQLIHALADAANAFSLIDTTLVHCQAGLNRSGMVTALALIKRGFKPDEAIAKLRALRCDAVLCNSRFVEFLRNAA